MINRRKLYSRSKDVSIPVYYGAEKAIQELCLFHLRSPQKDNPTRSTESWLGKQRLQIELLYGLEHILRHKEQS